MESSLSPGKSPAVESPSPWSKLLDKTQQLKASVIAKVEHPFRGIKCSFGFIKVRYKGLIKNTPHLVTLFAVGNLWIEPRMLLRGPKG
jgi:transposase, IS5 family